MEPSPPRSTGPPLPPFGVPYNPRSQVNLGQLAGPPKGITPFTVVGPRRTPATEEERGQPMVEPLIQGTTDLTISDRPTTPYHRADQPSPTPNTANPKPNGSSFGYPPQPGPNRSPATRAPSLMRVLRTRWCSESGSATRNREMGRGWGEEDNELLTRVAWVAVVVGG
jgi:hypothetical protein